MLIPDTPSHPARGAWIETLFFIKIKYISDSRTPPGVRGLKLGTLQSVSSKFRRTPPGVRGLKLILKVTMMHVGRRTPPGVRGLKL